MKPNQFNLQQKQLEKLTEIGYRLQQARQEQSVSLDEIAAQTRIQSRLLKAIEEGNIRPLPEPVYIRGFIKRFADALGLNGAEFASEFPVGIGFAFMRKPSWQIFSVSQLRPFHLYLLYVFVVICSVNALSNVVNHSAIQGNSIQANGKLINPLQSKEPVTGGATSEKFKVVNQLDQTNKPVRVGVTLKAASWIKIVADGKTQFEGELPTGTQLTWVANEQLTLLTANAGGVLVAFNDEKAKKLGATGQRQEVTFEANR